MTTVLAFILMFGLLVFVHEWGHLIFAKRAGMLVREFAIGFGPKIFAFTRNETVYTIRLLPVGGYVRVAGDDPEIIELKPGHHIGIEFNDAGLIDKIIVNNRDKYPNAQLIEVETVDLDHELTIVGYEIGDEETKRTFNVDEKAFFIMDGQENQIAPYNRQFSSKTVGQRAMQLFAGPMMNFILAIVLFIIIGLAYGHPSERALLGEIVPDSPAEIAGLQAGDEVIKMNETSISTWEEFTQVIQKSPNTEVALEVNRNDRIEQLTLVPKEVTLEDDEKVGQAGVMLAFEKSFFNTFKYGFVQTYETTTVILESLFMLITGQVSIDALSGPVGIYDVTDQIVQTGMMNYLLWTAMLSINLGIINLVPLPALDGGRLLFVGIEAIRGRPISPEREGMAHLIGFGLLMLLMIVVTWNDIQRFFL